MNTIALALSLIYLAETERGQVEYDQKGKMQITKAFLQDVNTIQKKRGGKLYDLSDRMDFDKSCEMAKVWLSYYGPIAERATGKTLDEYDLAVLYHTGLVGYLRGDGKAYRLMIIDKLAKLKPTDALIVRLKG